MKIGILIPCFNSSKFLNEAIESALNQETKNQILIYTLDDGSIDDTSNKLHQLAKEHSIHITLSVKNQGWCASYNELANQAIEDNCESLMIMGSDDILNSLCIEKMSSALTDNDFVVCYGKQIGNGLDTMTSKDNAIVNDFKNENVICNFVLIKSNMWIELNGYDTSFEHYSDWEFWIRAIKQGFKYCIVKEILYFYRLHENQTHRKANDSLLKSKILSKYY